MCEETFVLETLHHDESSRENFWFYGRHQPDLFCSLTQEIPSIKFDEGLPRNIEVMFDRSKQNICIIDDLMQSASGNQLVENIFTNGRHLNLSVVFVSQNLFYAGKNAEPSLCIQPTLWFSRIQEIKPKFGI